MAQSLQALKRERDAKKLAQGFTFKRNSVDLGSLERPEKIALRSALNRVAALERELAREKAKNRGLVMQQKIQGEVAANLTFLYFTASKGAAEYKIELEALKSSIKDKEEDVEEKELSET